MCYIYCNFRPKLFYSLQFVQHLLFYCDLLLFSNIITCFVFYVHVPQTLRIVCILTYQVHLGLASTWYRFVHFKIYLVKLSGYLKALNICKLPGFKDLYLAFKGITYVSSIKNLQSSTYLQTFCQYYSQGGKTYATGYDMVKSIMCHKNVFSYIF